MNQTKRVFIAIPVPEPTAQKISNTAATLNTGGVRCVAPGNMHITLLFLGDIKDDQIAEVKSAMSGIKQQHFEITIEGIGAFTPRPKVIFANVKIGAEHMIQIYDVLQAQLRDMAGFEERQQFVPHATVSRINVRAHPDFGLISTFVKQHGNTKFGSFVCDKIVLFSSTLTDKGPIYGELYTVFLS